jgi:hypothetical protein
MLGSRDRRETVPQKLLKAFQDSVAFLQGARLLEIFLLVTENATYEKSSKLQRAPP